MFVCFICFVFHRPSDGAMVLLAAFCEARLKNLKPETLNRKLRDKTWFCNALRPHSCEASAAHLIGLQHIAPLKHAARC